MTERAAAQAHFIDLCSVLGQKTPLERDPAGEFYAFEKKVTKLDGGTGFADVWLRNHFAWEYKRAGADLDAAYRQLNDYREALENPPLLVVCDLRRFRIHTNFTNTAKHVYEINLEEMHEPENLAILRNLFVDPNALRPNITITGVTEEAAKRFGEIALRLRDRGVEPDRTAHFLVQLLFCLFAEDTGLLPKGLFGRVLEIGGRRPEAFAGQIEGLFVAMRDGGYFGADEIPRFNGGLFAAIDVVPLEAEELKTLAAASRLDWSSVEPAIFGTLFERSLDPGKRAQLGAHYTGRADIERVVEPVLMAPLRRRREAVRAEQTGCGRPGSRLAHRPPRQRHATGWPGRLARFRTSCGATG